MDLGLMRGLVTLAAFITFIGIVIWAWSGARRERFEAAARLALESDDLERHAGATGYRAARPEQESMR